MMQFFSRDFYNINEMSITADVIDKCNYSCKYCCNKFPRTFKMLDLNQLKAFIEHVKNKLTDKNILVTLIGGETMLHPDLLQFCKDMDQQKIRCMIFTNFSMPYERYDEMPDNVSFTVSWHKSPSNVFSENLMKLQSNKLSRYSFYIMYEHDNIDESIEMFNKIKAKTRKVALKKIYNTFQYNEKYSQEQLDLFDDVTNDSLSQSITAEDSYCLTDGSKDTIIDNIYVNEDINPFKHWSCNAGLDNLHITIDGSIYPCCVLQPDRMTSFEKAELCQDKYKLGSISRYDKLKLKPVLLCNACRCCNYELKKTNVLNKKLDPYIQKYV